MRLLFSGVPSFQSSFKFRGWRAGVFFFAVTTPDDRAQQDLVRERFTRTAEQFAKFSLTTRAEEAELLVSLAAPDGTERAFDLACGPGTFTRAFAPRVKFILGLDLTPALVAQAREAAARAGLDNLVFALGDAAAIPLADSLLDLAVCAYSLHHFADAGGSLRELARVVQPGGCVALVDLIAPEEPSRAAANNAIERARDASHVTTLRLSDLRRAVQAAGLRIRTWQITQRLRSFDEWMRIAGWERGDPAYEETRRLMEASMPNNSAGFYPRRVTADLEWAQTSAFLIAEK